MKNTENLLLKIYASTVGDISFGESPKQSVTKRKKSKLKTSRSKQSHLNRKAAVL